MKEANPFKMGGYDLIAIGWPLMGPQLKLDVDTFLTDLRYVGGKHILLFSTSDSSDNNHAQALPLLEERDAIVIGSKSWHGSVYGPLGDPTPSRSDGRPNKADLESATNWAKESWGLSQKIYAGNTDLIPAAPARTGERGQAGGPQGGMQGGGARGEMPAGGPPGGMPEGGPGGGQGGGPGGAGGGGRGLHPDLIGLENDTPEELKKRIHFNLIYDQDKCLFPTCSRCMDFCPVHGIDFTVEPRVYADPCMMCMMCDQVCPTGAMTVDPAQMEWQRKVEYYGDDVVQVYQAYPKRPRFIVGYGRPYGIDPYTQEDRGDGANMKLKKE
jgi:ferredoxin